MSEFVQIVGCCDKRLFGLTPAERLRRQRKDEAGPLLVAHASAVLSDPAVAWLIENREKVLTAPSGKPLAAAVGHSDADKATAALNGSGDLPLFNPTTMPDVFVRKLRRRDRLLALSLDETPRAEAARALFHNVYKGVTDVVTKYVWPWPAFWVTRACAAMSIRPNVVTIVGIVAMLGAAVLWLQGAFAAGLACAWLMTFLDTVDGKLARVTLTSSWLGNQLDHGTDLIHPPVWWVCLAIGISWRYPAATDELTLACGLLLGSYVVGRLVETQFKRTIGYNAYLWQRFDSVFRLVIARRNTILLIVTAGLLLDRLVDAFALASAWSILSTAIQLLRYYQARQALRRGQARSWLM